MMKRLKRWFGNGNKQFKFSVYDPMNFNEIFDITASKIQIGSFVLLFSLVIGCLFLLLVKISPLGSYFFSSATVSHAKMVEQSIRMDSLTKKMNAQEKYIGDLKRLMFGDFDTTSLVNAPDHIEINLNTIDEQPSEAEQRINEKVLSDRQVEEEGLYMRDKFVPPVIGKISQRFVGKQHEGVDVVVKANTPFASCLPGTVLFSDYSKEDGNFIIVKHDNGFLSIYKHAQKIIKKRGDKVKAGEKIGEVGNTGDNSTGTHLHFELWLHQKPVDPKKYIVFEK